MGAFEDARLKAREDAGLERVKASDVAKARIGSFVGRAEASLREPLSDKVVRVVGGDRQQGKSSIAKGLGSLGKKFLAAGARFNANAERLGGGSSLGGSLGREIKGSPERAEKSSGKTITIKVS